MVKSNYNLSHGESQSFKHKKEANRGYVCVLLREVAMQTGHRDLARDNHHNLLLSACYTFAPQKQNIYMWYQEFEGIF